MSRVVYRPPATHECAPGWEWQECGPDGSLPGQMMGTPPWEPDFPRGTVWECDCGVRWLSRGVVGPHRLGNGYLAADLEWEREGWFARWRRLRRRR